MSVVDTREFITAIAADDSSVAYAPESGTVLDFRVKRFVLQALMEHAALVIPRTGNVAPVLHNFQITVDHDGIKVIATDTELSIISTSPLVAFVHPGTAVLPARKLLDILKEADDAEAHIRVHAGAAAITIGRTTWNLKVQSGADYPRMPDVLESTTTAVSRTEFAAALQTVRYAACKDPTRASLMIVDVRRGKATACDGARFQQVAIGEFPFEFQIPVAAVDNLVKMIRQATCDEITIAESANHLTFGLGTDVLIVTKFTAVFPDMEALLLRPALENHYPLTVERTDLLTTLRRVRITADPETSAVGLSLATGSLTVSARDKYGNTASETIDASWTFPDRTIVINHGYLIDMIQAHEGATLNFLLGDDTKTRRTPLMLRHSDSSSIGTCQQMVADWVGA